MFFAWDLGAMLPARLIGSGLEDFEGREADSIAGPFPISDFSGNGFLEVRAYSRTPPVPDRRVESVEECPGTPSKKEFKMDSYRASVGTHAVGAHAVGAHAEAGGRACLVLPERGWKLGPSSLGSGAAFSGGSHRAVPHSREHALCLWDALVAEPALSAGTNRLPSEGFQHGKKVEGLSNENPFL